MEIICFNSSVDYSFEILLHALKQIKANKFGGTNIT